MTTHLERLLFAQGNQCFFCREPLAKADASIEHLVASANGGTNSDDNCVACCKILNHLLGAKSIKEKLQVILNQRGEFRCPVRTEATVTAIRDQVPTPPPLHVVPKLPSKESAVSVDTNQLALLVENLRKRGATRPGKLSTLRNTIRTVIKQQLQVDLSDDEVMRLIEALGRQGELTISDNKVIYKLG